MEFVRSYRLWSKFLSSNGYSVKKCVGQGSFGDVFAVTNIETSQSWAVKRLVARRNIKDDSYAMAEIEALATIKHPTVVGLHEVLMSPAMACLVLELAPWGNLEMIIKSGWADDTASSSCNTNRDFCCGCVCLSGHCDVHNNNYRGIDSHSLEPRQLESNPFFLDFSEKDSQNTTESLLSVINIKNQHKKLKSPEMVDQGNMEIYLLTPPLSPLPPSPPPSPSYLSSTTSHCKKNTDVEFLRRAFTQIVDALDYIHSLGIAHRDINPSNVLVFSRDLVKLADFGLCFWCKRAEDTPSRDNMNGNINSPCSAISSSLRCSDYLGHDRYLAPEVLDRKPYYAQLADVWSLGCLLYFMRYFEHPPTDRHDLAVLVSEVATSRDLPSICINTNGDGINHSVSSDLSCERERHLMWILQAKQTLSETLQVNPASRPLMKNILASWREAH